MENEELKEKHEEKKSSWQLAKESQYAKLNVTEKQLNVVITVAGILLAIVMVCIALDAAGIIG